MKKRIIFCLSVFTLFLVTNLVTAQGESEYYIDAPAFKEFLTGTPMEKPIDKRNKQNQVVMKLFSTQTTLIIQLYDYDSLGHKVDYSELSFRADEHVPNRYISTGTSRGPQDVENFKNACQKISDYFQK